MIKTMTNVSYKLSGDDKDLSEVGMAFLHLGHSKLIDTYCRIQGNCSIGSSALDSTATYDERKKTININGDDVNDLKKVIKDEIDRRKLDITWKLVQ